MTVRQLPKGDRKAYSARVSKGLEGKRAQIEVTALPLGDQIATKWVPIFGITYDPKDDIIDIALDGLNHLVHQPRSLAVDEGVAGLSSLEIIDGEGKKQIVNLKEPLMLPPAGR